MCPSGSAPRRDSEFNLSNASEKLSITLRGIILDSVEIDGYGASISLLFHGGGGILETNQDLRSGETTR